MASPVGSGAKLDRPSFAKIAATGINPPDAQQSQKPATSNNQQHALTSSPPDGTNIVTPSDAQDPPAVSQEPKKLVQLASKDSRESEASQSDSPQVHVQAADAMSPPPRTQPAPDGLLMPTGTEDNSTIMSSSDGDGKPPSLDGKSVASATTFALDEKESLRPDDSASVQAAAEDDEYPPGAGCGLPSSRLGSDDGVPAFIDQLHEIRSMGPRRPLTGSSTGLQGVLYVPPQGPGIGALPGTQAAAGGPPGNAGSPPDHKLLEALENPRDRIWVLKLEQDVIDFVKDPKESSLNLPQCNSFYRMLAHKIADYYLLGHSVDDTSAAVKLHKTPYCRIPQPLTGVVTPSTAASTPPPSAGMQMKILRRGIDPGPAIANGSSMPSMANSENGDSGEEDKKKPVTREEREARYEAARLRIMGEARPSETAIAQEKKDDSRSSSAAGRKPKKKQRDNSDDGFEPRSGFTHYTPTSAGGYTGNTIAFQNVPNMQHPQMPMSSAGYDMSAYQQQPGSAAPSQWSPAMYPGQDGSQPWYQGQPQGYDLSRQFNQVMSFRQPGMPDQAQQSQAAYGPNYYQQPYGVPASWQTQPYPSMGHAPTPSYPSMQGYNDRSSAQQQQSLQGYAFGQLPSQAMGRPPNALEHPLPGSYKSPHFNPQSQTFVPSHGNGSPYSPYVQQRAPQNASAANQYGMPHQLERQMSSHSQASSFGSSQQGTNMQASRGMPTQPAQSLTHPLPQPVFPHQPSPNNPPPPKPVSELPDPRDYSKPTPPMSFHSSPQQGSSIAKWGAPASLPAKPPPSNEPFDAARFAQRTPNFNPAGVARAPNGGMQSFGPMGNPLMSGSGSPAGRRS